MRFKIASSLILPFILVTGASAADTTKHTITLTPFNVNNITSTLLTVSRSQSNTLLAYDSDQSPSPKGIWQSTDNASTWHQVLSQLVGWDQIAFEKQLNNPDVAVALVKNQLFKSVDAGVTWTPYTNSNCNMDENKEMSWGEITFVNGKSSLMFLEHTSGSLDKMYVSTDQGKTCHLSTLNDGKGAWNIASSSDGNVIIATSAGKMLRSTDHGESWQQVKFIDDSLVPKYDSFNVTFNPIDNNVIYAVDAEADIDSKYAARLWHSSDAGKSWEFFNYGQGTDFTSPIIVVNQGNDLLFKNGYKNFKVTSSKINPEVDDVTLVSDSKIEDGLISIWAPQAFTANNQHFLLSHLVKKSGSPLPTLTSYTAEFK